MKLDDLTLGQIKEVNNMFSSVNNQSSILESAIGKYCIVRTRNEGINCGVVVKADETGVVIDDARRIYYHKPKDSNVSWYEGVSTTGLHKDSKISGVTQRKYIIEDYSLTVCTEDAEQSLRSHEATKS